MAREPGEIRQMGESPVDSLGAESLAFVYGVAHLDEKAELVSRIEDYASSQQGADGAALRTIMGLTLAEAFSDAYLTWQIPGDPPEALQTKTTEWIVEGLTSQELTEVQRALIKPVVINVLGRIGEEAGESILDEEHRERIMKEGGITEEELANHQSKLIGQTHEATVKALIRELFGELGEE